MRYAAQYFVLSRDGKIRTNGLGLIIGSWRKSNPSKERHNPHLVSVAYEAKLDDAESCNHFELTKSKLRYSIMRTANVYQLTF